MKQEQFEQMWLMDWANTQPDIYPYLIHIPNEGKRHILTGHTLKKMGLKKGVSDLFLAIPKNNFGGFWIELKSSGGKPTNEQLEWIKRMIANGYHAGIYYGWVDAAKAICNYLDKKCKGL